VPVEQTGHLWDLLLDAGRAARGSRARGDRRSTGNDGPRLEKGYRAFGAELTPEYDPVEAGMTRAAGWKGRGRSSAREAYPRRPGWSNAPPAVLLQPLTVDYRIAGPADGTPRYMLGGGAGPHPGRVRAFVDAYGRAVGRDVGGFSGPSVGQAPADGLPAGPSCPPVRDPRCLVEYMGEQYPGDGRLPGRPCVRSFPASGLR